MYGRMNNFNVSPQITRGYDVPVIVVPLAALACGGYDDDSRSQHFHAAYSRRVRKKRRIIKLDIFEILMKKYEECT